MIRPGDMLGCKSGSVRAYETMFSDGGPDPVVDTLKFPELVTVIHVGGPETQGVYVLVLTSRMKVGYVNRDLFTLVSHACRP